MTLKQLQYTPVAVSWITKRFHWNCWNWLLVLHLTYFPLLVVTIYKHRCMVRHLTYRKITYRTLVYHIFLKVENTPLYLLQWSKSYSPHNYMWDVLIVIFSIVTCLIFWPEPWWNHPCIGCYQGRTNGQEQIHAEKSIALCPGRAIV